MKHPIYLGYGLLMLALTGVSNIAAGAFPA